MKKCPNCNATLVYRKDRQVYQCEYCKAEFRDESKEQEAAETPEKKIIYEYHHINVPDKTVPTQKAVEERKKNPGCLRAVFAVLGAGFALLGAGALSVDEGPAVGIVMIGIGIWLIVMAGRKK